jgi:hypothetical protein
MNELKELSPISSDLIRALEESISSLDCGSKNDIEPPVEGELQKLANRIYFGSETISIRLDATEADTLAGLLLGHRESIERDIVDLESRPIRSNYEANRFAARIARYEEYSALLNRTATLILQTLDAAKGGSR